jgi:hypothetical protein
MRLMEWWCILLTAKHGNTLTMCNLTFSVESRNVCLGLCTYEFNPFGSFVAPYSCWIVILTVYNLPPGMCIRQEFMFLSMIISGPSSPGRNIDVCLQLLIDELVQLWSSKALTYDISRKQNSLWGRLWCGLSMIFQLTQCFLVEARMGN